MRLNRFLLAAYVLALMTSLSGSAFAYNRDKATKYFRKHVHRNMQYDYFGDIARDAGGDCAKFASQVLIAGGYGEALKNWPGNKRWALPKVRDLDIFLRGISVHIQYYRGFGFLSGAESGIRLSPGRRGDTRCE